MNHQPVNLDQIQFEDILVIGPECHERFITLEQFPELDSHDWFVAGFSTLKGEYRVGRSSPDAHTLLFTQQGNGTLQLSTGKVELEPGTFCLLPVGQPFTYFLESGQTWKTAWVLLKNSRRWSEVTERQAGVVQNQQVYAVTPLMESLSLQADTVRRARLLSLLVELVQDILQEDKVYSRTEMAVMRLFSKLDGQLHFPWNQQSLAKAVHCSVPHFNRICRKLYQQGPMARLADMRLRRAKDLLIHSDWQISHIANQVGYKDAFNFSHWFNNREGVSPSQWRRNYR